MNRSMTRKNSVILLVALLCTALFVTACAGDPNRKTKIGAGVGAVLGGIAGSQLGDKSSTNAAIGAAVGALDSATLSGNAQSTFNKIAETLKNYDKTAIHVVGHTDRTGSDEYNMKLSQQRAQSVAQFLTSRGVDSQRVLTWGRGKSEPIASNSTESGRAQNRRVDIVIKPIVEGQESQAFAEPPYLGS